jgi:hypothetical protein
MADKAGFIDIIEVLYFEIIEIRFPIGDLFLIHLLVLS